MKLMNKMSSNNGYYATLFITYRTTCSWRIEAIVVVVVVVAVVVVYSVTDKYTVLFLLSSLPQVVRKLAGCDNFLFFYRFPPLFAHYSPISKLPQLCPVVVALVVVPSFRALVVLS